MPPNTEIWLGGFCAGLVVGCLLAIKCVSLVGNCYEKIISVLRGEDG